MTMDPGYRPDEQGPHYYMPSAMPPGVEYMHDERPPEGVYYFRIFAVLAALVDIGIVGLGLVMMISPALHAGPASLGTGEVMGGLVYGALGMVHFIPTMLVLLGPRSPWVHTLGTVILALTLHQCCCIPLLIPLLIVWMKPETKRWYGSR